MNTPLYCRQMYDNDPDGFQKIERNEIISFPGNGEGVGLICCAIFFITLMAF